ncbi:Atp8p (mitochondrion) [[Candida] subhashii]|uniref:ATP synthase protein 8 n=1 Tax=[Candida] subhashii TaxID=561895 RepID=D8WJ05_9ASCO|nr:Atp8p [[Candida] subhashii]ACY66199.1 Atp8p [[Candida] subhashii]AGS44270.1 ATP synthase F0 subunit 8 [[Candida] subhashii]APC61688.1 Atp8p [[Candida] subhashii]
MPQLIPFYFMHLLTVGIIGFSIALYLNATVTLPAILKRKLVRQTIVKG